MRTTILFLCSLSLSIPLTAQSQSQGGIEIGDLDRKADACTDFYEFANGTWRAQNPIPASMDRWSRRWAAGEANKEQLKTILEEAAAKHNQPRGSSQQLTGDFYGACMDESKINAAGVTPLKLLLNQVNAIQDGAGVQKMISTLQGMSLHVPLLLHSFPDPHNPSMVIADIAASGLGLPDRDYYLKPEERFKDAREKYVIHVAKMFSLAGYGDTDSAKAAERVMQFETALAKASLDNVAKRDPQQLDHKTASPSYKSSRRTSTGLRTSMAQEFRAIRSMSRSRSSCRNSTGKWQVRRWLTGRSISRGTCCTKQRRIYRNHSSMRTSLFTKRHWRAGRS